MVHRFVVAGYVTSYVVFSTAFGFASLLKSAFAQVDCLLAKCIDDTDAKANIWLLISFFTI